MSPTAVRNRKPAPVVAPAEPAAPAPYLVAVTHAVSSTANERGEYTVWVHSRATVCEGAERVGVQLESAMPDLLPRGGRQRSERLAGRRAAHERQLLALGVSLLRADRQLRDAHDREVREMVLRGKNRMLEEATGVLAPQFYSNDARAMRLLRAQVKQDAEHDDE